MTTQANELSASMSGFKWICSSDSKRMKCWHFLQMSACSCPSSLVVPGFSQDCDFYASGSLCFLWTVSLVLAVSVALTQAVTYSFWFYFCSWYWWNLTVLGGSIWEDKLAVVSHDLFQLKRGWDEGTDLIWTSAQEIRLRSQMQYRACELVSYA